jgi:hypothetical protein
MSHRPTKVSLHVEARILLTTVAGRSSMDRMRKVLNTWSSKRASVYRVRRHRRGRGRESLRVVP